MDITKRKITKIAREINKFTVRTLKKDGIGISEFDVIHVIRKNPGITQKEIGNILGIDKAAIARQCANLEDKGYLKRRKNPNDGRSQLLFATEKAEQLKNSKTYVESSFYEWLLEDLSEEEQQVFSNLLDILYLKCKNESKANFTTMTNKIESDHSYEKE